MKSFSRTSCYVYWFLPILILSGEVLSSKGKLKLVKKVKVGPVTLHSSHHTPDCPGPNCKSNGEPVDSSRLKRNNYPVMNGGGPQWQQPHPVMDLGHFEPSAAPMLQQPQFGGIPMGRSDNGQGMNGPSDQFQNPSGPSSGPPNNFQGTSGPFGTQPDFQGPSAAPMNSQPPLVNPGLPQNQHQPRFGEPLDQPGFQQNNFNFQNDPNFQGPQQFNNQPNNVNNPFPQNQFQNPSAPQFPNNPPDQFGAASFQQQSFNGGQGFPQGDPNNLQQSPQFPPQNQFPLLEMNNNPIPFPNEPQMNPNQNFNPPPNFPQLHREYLHSQGPGQPVFPVSGHPNGNQPLMAPFPNQFHPGQPFPTNTSYSPRTNADEFSAGTKDGENSDYNDGYDESETQVSTYGDDDYYDDHRNKGKHVWFKKHKSVNEDQIVSLVVQVAWKIISSYIFVFVANMLIAYLGKISGLSDSYVETHITLGNDGKHPFGNYAEKSGHASSYGSPGGPNTVGTGSKKGTYALSNGMYHPASALYQQPTYQYHKGGKDYQLHGYDQYQAVKYAKKYSKKYAKKAGKYGLRPKPIGPYLPAYQYGLPPGPLALGWTQGSGGQNGFYKRTGSSDEVNKKESKESGKIIEKGSGRNGDGIKVRSNSTEVEESEEGSDEEEAATTSLSNGNDTLSMTTVPTVEPTSTLGKLNETSLENDKSSTAEETESDSVEDDEGDEATTTLLPVVPEDENDIIKTSTVASISNSTTVKGNQTEIPLLLFKTGTRGRFSSLRAQYEF